MRFGNNDLDAVLLGARIREARERLRLSQGDLAAMVSKDQRAISEYENGVRKLAATDLVLFAKALEVPVMYFYEGGADEQDLDQVALSEFRRLTTSKAKQAAIDIIRILSSTLD
jgi:transcriptional regulator with XRE-family HTH domain